MFLRVLLPSVNKNNAISVNEPHLPVGIKALLRGGCAKSVSKCYSLVTFLWEYVLAIKSSGNLSPVDISALTVLSSVE